MAETIKDWCLVWAGWGFLSPGKTFLLRTLRLWSGGWCACPCLPSQGWERKLVLPLWTNFLLHACIVHWEMFLVSVSTGPWRNPASKVKSDPHQVSLFSAQTTASTHSFHIRSEPRFSGKLHHTWQPCWDHQKDSTCPRMQKASVSSCRTESSPWLSQKQYCQGMLWGS